MATNFETYGPAGKVKRKGTPNSCPESVPKGYHYSSIPVKFHTQWIPSSEKKGFNSQTKRFPYIENENPGPGFYNVTHQSALLNNVSQSRKGTCFFPSLDTRIARQRIPSYPAANAYELPPTLQSKRDFSLGYSSMFQQPIARKISKRSTPAPNQYHKMQNSRFHGPYQKQFYPAVPAGDNPPTQQGWIVQVSMDFCKQSCNSGTKAVFSSRTKRELSLDRKEHVPSPCHYQINESLIRQSPAVPMSCFQSRTSRETKPETLSPGPAAYQWPAKTAVAASRQFPGLRKYSLNFSAPPVPRPKTPPSPGPGQYEIVDYAGPSKHYISSAVFVSNTDRWAGDKFHEETPGPGTYNLPIPRKQSFIYNTSNKWIPAL